MFCEVFEYEMLPVRVVTLKYTSLCAMKPVNTFTIREHRKNTHRLYLNASVRTDGRPYVAGRSFGRGYSSIQILA